MIRLLKEIIAVYMTKRGKKREFTFDELEVKHVKPEVPSFNDSSYFAGVSKDGISFVTRQAFRVDKPNENWMMVHIPGEGVWGFENRPLKEDEGFKQGSLEYRCIKPGEKWKISFDGMLPKGKEQANLKLDMNWTGASPIVVFDKVGTTALQVGKQIAAEKWDTAFFKKLRELDQVHYEQAGTLKGIIEWKGTKHTLECAGVRDHSWGVRNWEDWDRHFWLLGLLEDGRFFNFSLISYSFVKNLQAAFIYDTNGYKTIYKLPKLEEMKMESPMPKTLQFEVQEEKGSKLKLLSLQMEAFFPFFMDEFYYLRQSKAHFEYDGVKGIGLAEMGINLNNHELDVSKTH